MGKNMPLRGSKYKLNSLKNTTPINHGISRCAVLGALIKVPCELDLSVLSF